MSRTQFNERFDALYQKLNTAQREAVDAIEGPVMVVAGPGTGKTQILTLRIANILRLTDTRPENILALTFTEAAVASMRRRLGDIIGSPAYSVRIATFHGFCNEIIQEYPEQFPHIIGAANITEVEQIKITESILDGGQYRDVKPFGDPYYYVRAIVQAINQLKREAVSPERFTAIIEDERRAFESIPDRYYDSGVHAGKMKGKYLEMERQIKKNAEVARIYEAYEKNLRAAREYDFSDMIVEVLRAFETNEDLLRTLQETYQYILVDEHQDTNNAQNKIVELLARFHNSPNVFVVGDEKQAIYRFQGASLENFLYFKKLYPDAKLVALEENYRSSQLILDSAESVLSGVKKLQSKTSYPDTPITVFAFSKNDVEPYAVVSDIKKKISSGMAPQEIAVLFRDNRDALPLVAAFEKLGVHFSLESDQDILSDLDIQKLIRILRAVRDFSDPAAIFEALHANFFDLAPLDIYKLIVYCGAQKIHPVEAVLRPAGLGTLEKSEKLVSAVRLFSSWRTMAANRPVIELFESIVRESGFLVHILRSAEMVEKMEKLGIFFDEIKALVERKRNATLVDFLEYLEVLKEHEILLRRLSSTRLASRVRLMTLHCSKGQEFEYVYIMNVFDGHFGNRRRMSLVKLPSRVFALVSPALPETDENADERRLFYVGLTRAKKEIVLTYAKESAAGREQLPSQFIGEIRPELVTSGDVAAYESVFDINRGQLFAAREKRGVDSKSVEFIRELFDERGFSVTALNNYLECPWKYFYTNLVRIPKAPEKHQMYGMAIHAALRDFYAGLKEREIGKDFLLQKFEQYLRSQPLAESDFISALERGREALSGYYDSKKGDRQTNILLEFVISGVILEPDIRLTGKLDKVEFLDAGGVPARVNVVDYKTGNPKSRNEIEGKTKTSPGDIKRQLVFYKLLLNLYENGRYRMESGEIDFVEPDERGRYRREQFIITDDEIEVLAALIQKTVSEIRSGVFLDRRCENAAPAHAARNFTGRSGGCEFCALRDAMG